MLIVSNQFESSINGESFWLTCILYFVFQGLILDFVPIYSEVRIYNYPVLNCEFHGIMWLCCSFVCTVILGHMWFSFLSLLLSCSKDARGPFCGGKAATLLSWPFSSSVAKVWNISILVHLQTPPFSSMTLSNIKKFCGHPYDSSCTVGLCWLRRYNTQSCYELITFFYEFVFY